MRSCIVAAITGRLSIGGEIFTCELDYLQYACSEAGETACGCRDIPAIDRKVLFNRVFSHPDKDGKTRWSNVHEDPNYFQPNNTKEVPSLLMLSARQVRNQLINMLNKKHLSAKVMSTVVSKCMICAPHFMASMNPRIIFSVNRSIARTIYLPSLSGFCGLLVRLQRYQRNPYAVYHRWKKFVFF